MKISIIIPAYNVAQYLPQCFKSILEQKTEDYEIIIVNDGSTDNTQDVIDEFIATHPNVPITAIKTENFGPAHARNVGMDAAQGEYISFIDADDTLSPDMHTKMYEKASAEDADVVLCGRIYIMPDGSYDSSWNPLKIEGVSNIFENKKLLPGTSSFVWDKLFKRETIINSGLRFNEDIHYAEDALFIYSFLYYAQRVASIQAPLYYYTIKRKNSITGAMDKRMFDEVKACECLTKFYLKADCYDMFQSELLWICIGFWGRKFYDVHFLPCDKKIMYEFVVRFYDFLKTYYPQWQDYLRKYNTQGDKRLYKINKYRTDLKKVKMYINIPSFLYRLYKREIPRLRHLWEIIKHLPSKIKGRLHAHEYYETYLNARKKNDIVDNRALYIANSGDNVACNVYAMMKEAYQRNIYDIYVAVKDPKKDFPMLILAGLKVHLLNINSDEFQVVLATAKYIVVNYRIPTYFTKRKGQVVMNTWHGTPLKTLGRHVHNGLIDLGNVQSQFIASDYLLYPNEYTKEKMIDAFCLDKLYTHNILVEGYPRNDIFFDRSYEKSLRKDLGLQGKKVFIYMPTWRGVSVAATSGDYGREVNSILRYLDEKLNDDVVLFVKLHNLAMKKFKIESFEHVKLFPKNLEIYYFINIADGLITDYSSVFYDFANTQKEIILFAYDKEKYYKERGMYENIDDYPFVQIGDTETLAEHLNGYVGFEPDKAYLAFLERYCKYDSLHTSTKVNDIFFGPQKDEEKKRCKYDVCMFADPSISPKVKKDLFELATKDNPLAVFATSAITEDMVELLKDEAFKDTPILVVQNEYVLSRKEQRALGRLRDKKIPSIILKSAIRREKERMMPGIGIKTIINSSNDYLFGQIAKYYSKHRR